MSTVKTNACNDHIYNFHVIESLNLIVLCLGAWGEAGKRKQKIAESLLPSIVTRPVSLVLCKVLPSRVGGGQGLLDYLPPLVVPRVFADLCIVAGSIRLSQTQRSRPWCDI